MRSLPFESDFFDFAYETCLCYVLPRDVEQAICELHRVVKVGVYFGGITSDMTREVIEEHDLLDGSTYADDALAVVRAFPEERLPPRLGEPTIA